MYSETVRATFCLLSDQEKKLSIDNISKKQKLLILNVINSKLFFIDFYHLK